MKVTPVLTGGIAVTIMPAGSQALPVIGSGAAPI
jgi:hypothetical protein